MRKGEEEGKKTRVLQLVQPGAGIDWTRRTHDRIELSSNFSPDAGQRSRVLNFFFFALSFFLRPSSFYDDSFSLSSWQSRGIGCCRQLVLFLLLSAVHTIGHHIQGLGHKTEGKSKQKGR